MKRKIDYLKTFINNNNIFICPICNHELIAEKNCFKCNNNHTFDFSSKGSINLIKTNNYKNSSVYNKNLFMNRRKFIMNGFYEKTYQVVGNIISKINGKINILDVGCGEATHSMNILKKLVMQYTYFGFDYSTDAINMATDYCDDNKVFFKASVDNIPVKDKSIDVILDFLSPFNEKEFDRVLKDDGIIVKISPSTYYLKELRKKMHIDDYSKEKEVYDNITKKFSVIENQNIYETFNINLGQLNNLIKMTPIENNLNVTDVSEITINLNIYVLKVKK